MLTALSSLPTVVDEHVVVDVLTCVVGWCVELFCSAIMSAVALVDLVTAVGGSGADRFARFFAVTSFLDVAVRGSSDDVTNGTNTAA